MAHAKVSVVLFQGATQKAEQPYLASDALLDLCVRLQLELVIDFDRQAQPRRLVRRLLHRCIVATSKEHAQLVLGDIRVVEAARKAAHQSLSRRRACLLSSLAEVTADPIWQAGRVLLDHGPNVGGLIVALIVNVVVWLENFRLWHLCNIVSLLCYVIKMKLTPVFEHL